LAVKVLAADGLDGFWALNVTVPPIALDFIRNKEPSVFRSPLAVPDSEVVQPTSHFHGRV
jgi:hypothetical protein